MRALSKLLLVLFSLTPTALMSQGFQANYDESKIPPYELPVLLRLESGAKVATAEDWRAKRRPEILELFRREVYGRQPTGRLPVREEVILRDDAALGGKARRRVIRLHLGEGEQAIAIDVLLHLPPKVRGPVPVFLGLNFQGNHATTSDPAVPLATSWVRQGEGVVDNRATDATRGRAARRWPVELVLAKGYGLATAYYGDIDPDFDDGWKNGVHPLFPADGAKRPGDAWGSVATWAWGLSRIVDYFETAAEIDHTRIALVGHSRLGKTALWAGAEDERFSIVISNDSGCGGAALSRRAYGETIGRITRSFPHWFAANYNLYRENEGACPVDQHQLIALIAPRPVYVASASADRWADPRGEFLAARAASEAWKLSGHEGLAPTTEWPAPGEAVGEGSVGYHLREGPHDINAWDWERYLSFAARHWKRRGG